ncbi:hypothetical protein OsJ_14435 [Oryza sativa Japonica Group]|uniref:Uncharacterized protein n=1 Tax=Oryza sativa subsp. japonica TaxID=39947 RepID=B9FEP1_ORYSJ|nr:hypothetical protein OsJ_14435 [Oryza sativa Japonica Group]
MLGDGGRLVAAFMRATAPPPQIPTGRRRDGRSKRHRIDGSIRMQRPEAERLTLEDSRRCLAFPLVKIDG